MIENLKKCCTKCGEDKSFSDFHHRHGKPVAACKTCTNFAKNSNYHNNKSKYKDYAKANKDKIAARMKEWRAKNKEKIKQDKHNWDMQNRQHRAEYQTRHAKEDVQYGLSVLLRRRLWGAVCKGYKAGSAVKDLGMSLDEFKTYLESKFTEGMSWSNRGAWHIDHVVPLTWFDLTNREQLKYALRYDNLQPMWAEDNLSKGNRHAL